MSSKPREPRRWQCETCGAGVTVYVDLSEPPTHPCSKRNGKVCRLKREHKKEAE